MNMYAIVFLKDENREKVVEALSEIDKSVFKDYSSRGVYFVRFSGTAKQLAENLGMSGDYNAPRTGIVMKVTQYFGFANRDLWTWLSSK